MLLLGVSQVSCQTFSNPSGSSLHRVQDPTCNSHTQAVAAPVATPAATAAPAATSASADSQALLDKINAQAIVVRDLKAAKAAKPDVEAAVKTLLELKQQYKALTGQEPPTATTPAAAAKPEAPKAAAAPKAEAAKAAPKVESKPAEKKEAAAAPAAAASLSPEAQALLDKINAQGEAVRIAKAAKADKETVEAAVKALLALKVRLERTTCFE
jgi:bifunctional glutamyl/prolyl-tRNA synthetase